MQASRILVVKQNFVNYCLNEEVSVYGHGYFFSKGNETVFSVTTMIKVHIEYAKHLKNCSIRVPCKIMTFYRK